MNETASKSMASPKKLYRLPYEAPDFLVKTLHLTFDIHPDLTTVTSRFTLEKNTQGHRSHHDFLLNGGDNLTLQTLTLNGKTIDKGMITFTPEGDILLQNLPLLCQIELTNTFNPRENTQLEGIYLTDDLLVSDCEPEGFRRITYFPDRPDILATYTVKIIADKKYPTLLSNGNLLEMGEINDGKHYTLWHDPFPKPSYLFALVVGELSYLEDSHIRPNGKPVTLRAYARKPFINQCQFALQSLKRAMKWDEERFGLVCDLDYYHIVGVDDFNAGAMENKGLNIFNTKVMLADPKTATDEDFKRVEAVIAHEYFHNWTGNRVTLQDWFNLAVKEALTVFREQEFSAEMNHPGLARITDVKRLRQHQFPEDSGPLSHPIRLEEAESVENFYTLTVYEKGAEVIRLCQTILGKEGFKKGLQYFLTTYDGQAVSIDEFIHAMENANQTSLKNIDRWYSQAGTPELYITSHFDNDKNTLQLSLRQVLIKGKPSYHKEPQPIPLNFALLSSTGEILLEEIFLFDNANQCVVINGIKEKPILSLLRNFSAPVILHYPYRQEELIHILHFDTDYFARYEAITRLYEDILLSLATDDVKATELGHIFRPLLEKAPQSPEFYAELLTLPTVQTLHLKTTPGEPLNNPLTLYNSLKSIKKLLAQQFSQTWEALYQQHSEDTPSHRALKNIALDFLTTLGSHQPKLKAHYYKSDNMTDRQAALKLAIRENNFKDELLNNFLTTYQSYPLVIDSWFMMQATNPMITLTEIKALTEHPHFSFTNPNRVRALLGAYGGNLVALTRESPASYNFHLAMIKKIDALNPKISSQLITPYARLNNLAEKEHSEILILLQTLLERANLSVNLTEQLQKIL